jgi:transcription initiation factor IIE alpha subunit
MEGGEHVPGVVRQAAQLEELGPDSCTDEALSDATSYKIPDVRSLMAEAVTEGLAAYDNVRHVWLLTTKGLGSIETI